MESDNKISYFVKKTKRKMDQSQDVDNKTLLPIKNEPLDDIDYCEQKPIEHIKLKQEYIETQNTKIKKEYTAVTNIKEENNPHEYYVTPPNSEVCSQKLEYDSNGDEESISVETIPEEEQQHTSQDKPQKFSFSKSYIKVDDCYICLICTKSKQFLTRDSAARHIKYEHYGIKYSCTECDKEYKEKGPLRDHLREKHQIDIEHLKVSEYCRSSQVEKTIRIPYYSLYKKDDENYFVCLKCSPSNPSRFKGYNQITTHIRSEHYGIQFVCPECKKQFTTGQKLRLHLGRMHQINIRNLNKFDYIRKPAESLDYWTRGPIEFEDGSCVNYELETTYLTKHEVFEPKQNVNLQEIIQKKSEIHFGHSNTFSYGNSYKKVDDHFVCMQCTNSAKFASINSVSRHLRTQHFGIQFTCPECGNKYKDRAQLKHHLKNKHQVDIRNVAKLDMITKVGKKPKITQGTLNNTDTTAGAEDDSDNDIIPKNNFDRFSYEKFYKRIANFYHCLKCPQDNANKFSDRAAIASHLRKDHFGIMFKCPKCKKEVKLKTQLKTHLKRKHQIDINSLSTRDYIKKTKNEESTVAYDDCGSNEEIVDIIVKEEPQIM